MPATTLLTELDPLTHAQRIQRMVMLGRTAAEATTQPVLAALEGGDVYQRSLALHACAGSGNGGFVLRSLADPSQLVRGLATQLAPLICSDDQLREALDAAALKQRLALLRRLRNRRRMGPVDAFITTLAARDDPDLDRCLPFATAGLVAQHAPPLWSRVDVPVLRRLARLHPTVVLDILLAQAAATTEFDQRLVWQANAVLPLLVEAQPDQTLTLVQALERTIPLAQLRLQPVVDRRPIAMADLILQAADQTTLSFDHVAHRLPLDQLQALIARQPTSVSDHFSWFRRLTPVQRGSLATAYARSWRDAEDRLDSYTVGLLPRDLREAEGRRHLQLPALAARPTQRLPYAAFLPWDQAQAELAPFIRNPDAELRATALTALALAVRYHRDQLPTLLAMIRARRNEQDPVRRAMLEGLAELPPSIWQATHLAELGAILREALDAVDLSTMTAQAAERLVVALIPFHPAWAVPWLATLVQERGAIQVWDLAGRLTDADMQRLAPALLPVLTAWETREREGQLVSVAQSLGRRLRVFDALVTLIERVIANTRSSWTAISALNVLAEHRPDRFVTLIPRLIAQDQSTITLDPVLTYLHRRRQDLLTPFLGQQAYRGRFSTGKTRYVLPLTTGFYRWTPTQQAIFAQTLVQLTHDEARDSPALLQAITQLAALPHVEPTRLIQLADGRNPRLITRDAALRALGRLDVGQGVPILLAAMGDDRARIAIYVLRRALLAQPEAEALALLRSVPLTTVTVAKEVVRLVGDLRSDAAYAYLLELDGTELHRDVRVALLRALWTHLERPATWPILERAATAADPALATGVVRIPAERLGDAAQGRLVALLATLLLHPDAKLRLDVLARCATLPIRDSNRVLLPRLLDAVESSLPDEQSTAAQAIFATYVGRDSTVVTTLLARLLPQRRALQTLLQALSALLPWNRRQLVPTARAVLTTLADEPLLSSFMVELALLALPWTEVAALLQRMAARDELHGEALMRAVHAIERTPVRPDADDLAVLEAALTSSPDARLRRLALAALVAQAQGSQGWDTDWLIRLRAYRSDEAPLVAAAAQFTFPASEGE